MICTSSIIRIFSNMQTISEGECGDKQNVCNDNNRRIFSARTQVTLLYFYTFILLYPPSQKPEFFISRPQKVLFLTVFRSKRAVLTISPPYIMPNGTYERKKYFVILFTLFSYNWFSSLDWVFYPSLIISNSYFDKGSCLDLST